MADGATKPAIVFLHGIGGAAGVWGEQVARLAASGYRTLALDLPGYGGRRPLVGFDFEGLAADVEGQIAARGLSRPVLVGHSLGGMIAQTLLRRSPDGYAAALLACTSAAFGNADGAWQQKFIAARLEPLDAGAAMADLAPGLIGAMLGPNPDWSGRALAIAAMSAVPPETYRAAVRCLVTFDERANLAQIRVATLCLAGERDPNAPPAVMQRMAAKIPGARFVCLLGLGHLPNLEAPEVFNAAMLDFLRRLPQPDAGRRCMDACADAGDAPRPPPGEGPPGEELACEAP